MWLTPHARQLPGALFVRRLRFRLVKNKNRKMMRVYSVYSGASVSLVDPARRKELAM